MIEAINYINKDIESTFESKISDAYSEVRQIRENLPDSVRIYFTDKGIIKDMSTGGYAYGTDVINLAIDPNETDQVKVALHVRATIFHESFHLSMGYTGETGPFGLLDCLVQEGAATLFEIKYAQSPAAELYGNYTSEEDEKLQEWLNYARNPQHNILTNEGYDSFAYYDEHDNVRWKLYKIGTWIVDTYLKEQQKDIKDFNSEDAQKIVQSLQKF